MHFTIYKTLLMLFICFANFSLQATPWHKDAVFYELFVRSFYDTNDDGVGDIKGVIEKLDYLEDLGITALWLMPITTFADGDHGYETSDYMTIDPSYGTNDDFKELIVQAEKRGIAIIMDLVINHCSSMHPFFVDAIANPNSPYRDWFIWSDTMLYWHQPWSTNNVWHKTNKDNLFYYGLFSSQMPDFNYKNKEVRQYIESVFSHWINQGVKGFRIDAAAHIFENGNGNLSDQQETFDYFKTIRSLVDKVGNEIFLIGEAEGENYTGDGTNKLHCSFNFDFIGLLTKSIYHKDSSYFANCLLRSDHEAQVLNNHDSFLGPRVMTRFKNNHLIARLSATLLLTSPGIPFIYYGEEIGMISNNRYSHDWSLRTPMQWNNEPHSGFSKSRTISPRKVNRDYKKNNVENQQNDPQSLFSHYKKMISIRSENPTLSRGTLQIIKQDKEIIHFSRKFENETIHIISNITNSKKSASFSILKDDVILYSSNKTKIKNKHITLSAYSSIIVKSHQGKQ